MAGILDKRMLGLVWLHCALAFDLQAGGSGLNTVVVVNQTSSNSCELGSYFCEHRQVPPENVLRISWAGGNILWTSNDFQSALLSPLAALLANRQLTNQVEYVVLSMDIPFQTSLGSSLNGTTSALFYGLKSDAESDPTNSYASSEAAFCTAKPASVSGFSFLCTMLTADTLAQAKQLVDQGVASDGSFPTRPVVLTESSDPARNIRHSLFDNAIFNVRVRGVSSITRTNSEPTEAHTSLLGCELGLANYSLPPATFVPGAIGDSLTSFGGVIFGTNSQTDLLEFIHAGAAGSYGTVAEPTTDAQKFPDPQVYFYQARGFGLAESYYQSINVPYLGLIVAEPLAAPFARKGLGKWGGAVSNAILSGLAPLAVQFSAAGADRPLQQVDLFVDGTYLGTLTNLAPAPGNILNLSLNGYPIAYTVPTNATLGGIAADMTALINTPAATNATKVKALARGDRIELQSLSTNFQNASWFVADVAATNSPMRFYRVSSLPASFRPRLIPAGLREAGNFGVQAEIPTAMTYLLQASTNLTDWLPLFTNTAPGLMDYEDADARNYSRRFYRILGPVPDQPPTLWPEQLGGALRIHAENEPGQPCAIFTSTNLFNWVPLLTNAAGGTTQFTDTNTAQFSRRFYRAGLVPPAPPATSVLNSLDGTKLVRVDNATLPYLVESSTNQTQWTSLATNFAIASGEIATGAGSAAGNAATLTTFLSASRPSLMASDALGKLPYRVIPSTPPVGAWMQCTVTKTNGELVMVGVTNAASGTTSAQLAEQLCALINSNALLQAESGLDAEDYAVVAGAASFNLYARCPGYPAATIRAHIRGSAGLTIMPSYQRTLTQNLSDLLPRNHLSVFAGADRLDLEFALDTTALADGWHELTAVAYEGTHVRTQTRATVPVRIENHGLSATLTLLGLTNSAPVQGTCHIQVDAGTNEVATTTLYSTGGAFGVATNSSLAIFAVDGTRLWAGLHPFYALVETAAGLKYRTETRWVRFLNEP